MNRRRFLIVTLTSLAGLATMRMSGLLVSPTAPFQFKGQFFKGAAASKILTSADGKTAWTQVAEFGPACQVRHIAAHGGMLIAEIGLGRHSFTVESSDGRVWYSHSYTPVAA